MISYTEVQNIAADIDFAEALLSGERIPLTSELVHEIREVRRSLKAASEILNALPVEVVEGLPIYLRRD
jgi:hypothetical protein